MACPCCGYIVYNKKLYDKLKELQKFVKFDILESIISGCRCKTHNEAVCGDYDSYHMEGKAALIYIGAVSWFDKKITNVVAFAKQVGFNHVVYGKYNGVFMYVDIQEKALDE